MLIAPSELRQLLHTGAEGALATQSSTLRGYPHCSALPYAPDRHGQPVFLLSRLAEHTHNLLADPRCSFLVRGAGEAVESQPRVTLLGRIEALPEADIAARYLRYQPRAADYLSLGDFRFFVLQVERLRMIGGFARMGWLEGSSLRCAAAPWPPELEDALVHLASETGLQVLGADPWGLDTLSAGQRQRIEFASACSDAPAWLASFAAHELARP